MGCDSWIGALGGRAATAEKRLLDALAELAAEKAKNAEWEKIRVRDYQDYAAEKAKVAQLREGILQAGSEYAAPTASDEFLARVPGELRSRALKAEDKVAQLEDQVRVLRIADYLNPTFDKAVWYGIQGSEYLVNQVRERLNHMTGGERNSLFRTVIAQALAATEPKEEKAR